MYEAYIISRTAHQVVLRSLRRKFEVEMEILLVILVSFLAGMTSVLIVNFSIKKESKWYIFARNFLVPLIATMAGTLTVYVIWL